MVEKSPLGIFEILLHIACMAICVGVIISCGVTLSTVDDLFGEVDDDSEAAEDRDAYNAVAGWLIFVSIAGIISQVLLLVFRLLYYFEAFSANFTVFAVIAIIFTVLLALGLVSGGIPSAANAANIQEDYLDPFRCDSRENYRDSPAYSFLDDTCDDLEQIRNSQIASAVLSFIGAGASGILALIILVAAITRGSGGVV